MKTRTLIFVIGPMNDTEEPESTRDHTMVIRDAIEDTVKNILRSAGKDKLAVDVRAPIQDRGSDIPNDVFNNIDVADLIVADISLPNPAVFYELAFAHCLGIPTILVKDVRKGEDAFYLKVSRYIGIEGIEKNEVKKALAPVLKEWLEYNFIEPERASTRSTQVANLAINPITKFYENVPLLDISAAAGLALGYFESLITPLMGITEDVSAFREALQKTRSGSKGSPTTVDKITGLVIVKPATLENIKTHMDETVLQLQSISEEIYGEAKGATKGQMLFDCGKFGKRTAHVVVEGVAIDIPRTIYTLWGSERLRRLSENADLSRKMERILIGRFADRIIEQARLNSRTINRERLCLAPIEGLAEAAKDLIIGKESRFSVKTLFEQTAIEESE